MIHLSLAAHSERAYQIPDFFPDEFSCRGHFPLYGQWRTYDALVNSGANIVVNTYPTGSGKTKAALLYLRELCRRPIAQANCLFIAPTNELLQQHARDIRDFCERNRLGYRVLPLTSAYMDDYARAIAETAPEMRRRAAKLVEVLKNPRVLPDTDNNIISNQQIPYILVTNPDIYYYAVYNGYGRLEERTLMKQFLGGFDYLVIDEFHYYNPKQLANFLFFLSTWRHFGLFESGAKVCLLSATPNAHVSRYLRQLEQPLQEVGPENEPADPDAPEVASLAPVELDALSTDEAGDRGLVALLERQKSELRQWLDEGQHGAVISSALWRINLINAWLGRSRIPQNRFARLTGVESRQAREAATRCDLILATPTVDLGYNFERTNKSRQSIDFLFFDATFADEFTQRLGRAGRVLGKQETTIPSRVLAILPKELIEALRPLEGRNVTRAELREAINTAITERRLSERNTLFDYIASGAIEEAFLPILRLRKMASSEQEADIRDLYEHVRKLFEASDRYRFDRLAATTKRYEVERDLFRDAPTDERELVAHLLKAPEDRGVRLWLQNMGEKRWGMSKNLPSSAVATAKERVSKPESPNRREFATWAVQTQMEYAIHAASFNFRESFEEPQARVYDPQHLISTADTADYGLFHIMQNCDVEVMSPEEWAERIGAAVSKDERILLHCAIRALRESEQRVRLLLRLHASDERHPWESEHACKMTALLHLDVFTENGQLPFEMASAVKDRFVPAFLAPKDTSIGGKLVGLARDQGMRLYSLEVTFPTGAPHDYFMLLGTSALLAAARLRQQSAIFHRMQEKDFHDPIWC